MAQEIILSVIILNYKTKGLLKQCIKGIQLLNLPVNYEIIAVDNHSNDDSVKMMRENFPNIKCIESPQNNGCAAGNNLGIKEARGQYIMILNPDIAIFEGVIEKLLKFMDNNPNVGVVAPKLINPDGTRQISCYRFPRFMTPIYRRTPLGKLPSVKKKLRDYLMLDYNFKEVNAVDWVLGACMLVRSSSIEKVGLMDERFELYFEDVDWCRQFWQAGFLVCYLNNIEIVHYHQRLSAENPGLRGIFSQATRIHIASALKYFAKYWGAKKINKEKIITRKKTNEK
ncbi:MAG: glycosyltransferase family 2 protein [Patescibacteria group bacterium]|nr:glycosyltransferase family 2 protein [Patescibacteria group bacterium]